MFCVINRYFRSPNITMRIRHQVGARLRIRTTTQRSEEVLGSVLGKGSQKGPEKGAGYCFTVREGSEKGSQNGSEKGVSRRCLDRPLGEYDLRHAP